MKWLRVNWKCMSDKAHGLGKNGPTCRMSSPDTVIAAGVSRLGTQPTVCCHAKMDCIYGLCRRLSLLLNPGTRLNLAPQSDYGRLSRFDGLPGFAGRGLRPAASSWRSTNVASSKGQPRNSIVAEHCLPNQGAGIPQQSACTVRPATIPEAR